MNDSVLVHKHLIVRAEAVNPPMDVQHLTDWLHNFINSINMKVLMGPYVTYHDVPGNRGITGAAIIETSHIVMHVWDECSPALMQFDVYSCGAFDPETICKKITRDFDVTKIEYKFLDRENDLTDIGGGSFKPLTAKSYEDKVKLEKEKILLKNRKEVDINKDGSGYTIKEGPNKGKTLAHIRIPTKKLNDKDTVVLLITAGVLILLAVIIVGDYLVALEENRPVDESVITLMKMSVTGLIGVIGGYIGGKN
jgi:S-adenosylmethionine/arginine decarboxylase-like enzyme